MMGVRSLGNGQRVVELGGQGRLRCRWRSPEQALTWGEGWRKGEDPGSIASSGW